MALVAATGAVAAACGSGSRAGTGSTDTAAGVLLSSPTVMSPTVMAPTVSTPMPGAIGGGVPPAPSTGSAPSVPPGPCPSGTPLGAGHGQARDYVDLVRLDGRSYLRASAPEPADGPALGPVVAHVRCSLFAHDSADRSEPDWTDPGSTFVPDGSPIYSVAGVPVACQVAARSLDGKVHVYTVQLPDRPAKCPP